MSIAGSGITNEPIETSLRNCRAANVNELANSKLAMHASLVSWVASMDADSYVHFATETPQQAANLYVDDALSSANMAQLFAALARAAKWRVGNFDAQALANTA